MQKHAPKHRAIGRNTHRPVLTVATATALTFGSLFAMAPAQAAASDVVTMPAATRTAAAQEMLDLINAHRASKGLAPVKYSATLSGIAQGQSDRLVRDEVIDHTTTFMTDPRAAGWDAVGEIHAISWRHSVPDLVNWWKSSSAHNKVMTDPKMEVIGIGLTYVDGSLAGDGSGWRLVGTVASYGYPDGKGPADASTRVTAPTTGPLPAPAPAPAPPAPTPAPAPSPTPLPAGPYRDVAAGHQFAAEITWVRDRGYLNGWSDGTFRPDLPIERAAMAAVMYRMAGSPAYTAPSASAYLDLAPGDPFYKEVHWARDSGLLNGWNDGTFRPTAPIARDATAALLYRAAGAPGYSAPGVSPFTDVATGNRFYKEMAWMRAEGISTGWADGSFRPVSTTNRDAMAAFLYRFTN
ncbi:hypothetical protein GCM10011374_35550 [Kocuria dechangensis]|uniref:SLH domain-containing protein n=1 Tax=Kocuria dechangensis TaxID=1176249 RepID=A0A917H5V3_9MICC|nr:S-layer homology domain-containing protein [Kocuria dechangensis]GGG68130.1 hypothetical protein GCM10011374_35550 [Kocuria dechangensis]